MSQKAEFIKVPIDETGMHTMPVDPQNRLPDSEISIALCDETDVHDMTEGTFAAFPDSTWARMEPPELRPDLATRKARFAKRIIATFQDPHMHWVKAVLTSNGKLVGAAGWLDPGNGIKSIFQRSAVDFYGWQERMGWSDEEVDEMWSGVGAFWNSHMEKQDAARREILGDEPHWYLNSLFTLPGYQGKGVAKKLLNWGIEQADKTEPVTPMYLESSMMARAVYMHCGFVPQGESNMLRRGPAVVRGEGDRGEGEKKRRFLEKDLQKVDVVGVTRG